MKLIKCDDVNVHPMVLRNLIVTSLLRNLASMDLNYNKCIKDLESVFSLDDIRDAIKSIYYDGFYINTPEGQGSVILRYLEFGGENVKASNLISSTIKEIKKELGVGSVGR